MNNLLTYANGVSQSGVGEGSGIGAAILAFLGTFFLFIFIFIIASFILWIWALVDALKKTEADFQKIGNGEKNLWLILLISSIFFGFHFIVSIIYLFIIYQPSRAKSSVKKQK
jgi:hypothetical protein